VQDNSLLRNGVLDAQETHGPYMDMISITSTVAPGIPQGERRKWRSSARQTRTRSEDRDRVDRRSRCIGKRERIDGQHELPAIAGGGRLAQRLEIGAVEHVDP